MIIDAHAHYGDWYFPIENPSADAIVAKMAKLGVDRVVLSSSLAIVYDFREGNAELAEAMRGRPGLAGYVSVNANYPEESLAEMETYLGKSPPNGFVGVKVHPQLAAKGFDCPECVLFAEAAARYDVPILIHTFATPLESPWNVARVAEKVPAAKFILGHMGGYDWESGIAVGKARPNTWLEICSTCTDPRKLRAAIEAVGAGRVLFGTDATLFAPEYMLGAMDDMGLSAQERAMVMGGNALRLFGFAR
jgi:uncharacterized protein